MSKRFWEWALRRLERLERTLELWVRRVRSLQSKILWRYIKRKPEPRTVDEVLASLLEDDNESILMQGD